MTIRDLPTLPASQTLPSSPLSRSPRPQFVPSTHSSSAPNFPLSAPRWLPRPHSLLFRPPSQTSHPRSVHSTHSSPASQISSLGPKMAFHIPLLALHAPSRSPHPRSMRSTHSIPAPQIPSLGPEMASQIPQLALQAPLLHPSLTVCALNTFKPRPPIFPSQPRDGFPDPLACPSGPPLAPLAHGLCTQRTQAPPPKSPLGPEIASQTPQLAFQAHVSLPSHIVYALNALKPHPQIPSLGPKTAFQTP